MAQDLQQERSVRETSIARILMTHCIRWMDVAEVLVRLRQKLLVVGPGTLEWAIAHIRTVAARLGLANRQIKQAHRRLDDPCAKLAKPATQGAPGQQCDTAILRPLPGVGRIVLAKDRKPLP